jgi:hypothetical protein
MPTATVLPHPTSLENPLRLGILVSESPRIFRIAGWNTRTELLSTIIAVGKGETYCLDRHLHVQTIPRHFGILQRLHARYAVTELGGSYKLSSRMILTMPSDLESL